MSSQVPGIASIMPTFLAAKQIISKTKNNENKQLPVNFTV
jgi:hypothetical protein